MKNIFKYLESYSSLPKEVDKLIVSAFIEINNLRLRNNRFLRSYSISKRKSAKRQKLLQFIEIIQSEMEDFNIEKLIELFEFVISPSDRIINGAIYTPCEIRDYIVHQTFKNNTNILNEVTIADISCGCSGFLYTASKELKRRTRNTYQDIFQNQIFGLDIQEYSVIRSRLLLSLLALSEGEDVEEFHFNLQHKAQMSTVLMIDISHSMILYGEDRITPAKKVAMALVELIKRKYPKDSIDIIVFGNDAWPIQIKDLPYLQVGPYHTNTVAGLELAMDILRRKRNTNKQIFMITDGKPSCLKLPTGEYYMNSVGLDEKIVSECLNRAAQARKLKIPITTFMIAQDPYLRQFVKAFTAQNKGKAFLTGLSGLGQMIFEDYEKNRIKRI